MTSKHSLLNLLSSTNMTELSIQTIAKTLLSLYKTNPTLAANSWAESVHRCSNINQYLPLLYVANEVLQTSKRKFGDELLRTFSLLLYGNLWKMGQGGRVIKEKVVRTVKIWGERQVYSPRFINELLQAIDSPNPPPSASSASSSSKAQSTINNDDDDMQSNPPSPTSPSSNSMSQILKVNIPEDIALGKKRKTPSSENNNNSSNNNDDDDDDDDDTAFDDSSMSPKKDSQTANSSSSSQSTHTLESLLSTHNSLRTAVTTNKLALSTVQLEITSNADPENYVANVVGEELVSLHLASSNALKLYGKLRSSIVECAIKELSLDKIARVGLAGYRERVVHDREEVEMSHKMEKELNEFRAMQSEGRIDRKKRQLKDAAAQRKLDLEEAKVKAKKEKEVRKEALDKVLTVESENKVNKVWDPIRRVYIEKNDHTEDAWRR